MARRDARYRYAAITGHIGDAVYMAAIAVGGTVFNVLYWLFNFLRMGTTGML